VVRSAGPGNALWLTARPLDAACATNVFSAIGEVGRSAEDVAAQVADAFLRWREARTSVEEHLADQIMLPIAIAGAGSFTCNALSLHARTHLEVIDAFLGRRFEVWDLGDGRYRLTL
jgi:RNA 3'-terminal phosphate cyclase (ATP)